MKIQWQYVWMGCLGAFVSHCGITYRQWEFYVILALVLAYGICRRDDGRAETTG